MTQLCTIDDIADELGVPKASLKTAAETHGFIYRFGDDCIRIMRDDVPALRPLAVEEAEKPSAKERLSVAIQRLIHPPEVGPELCRGIPIEIRRAVVERDGAVCAYCKGTEGPFALDHIHPFSRGGLHTVENLTVACSTCNSSKGDKLLKNWKGRRQ